MAKMIVLKSSDGESFEVEEAAALLSQTLKHMIEDNCADAAIPLSNVTGKTLAKVIEYCNRHAVDVDEASSSSSKASKDNELKKFDAEFMTVDIDTLYDIIMAANYLDIKSLLDLSCQTAAGIIKGKTPEQIRSALNIENDFTPEEEEEIRNRNPWAFE